MHYLLLTIDDAMSIVRNRKHNIANTFVTYYFIVGISHSTCVLIRVLSIHLVTTREEFRDLKSESKSESSSFQFLLAAGPIFVAKLSIER